MAEHAIEPTQADAKVRSNGRTLIGTGVALAVLILVAVFQQITIAEQGKAIGALSGGVTVLRNQVDTCANKPAKSAGCTTPAAAEPSIIVKEVRTVSLPGLVGDTGPSGAIGKAGIDGKSYGCDGKVVDSNHPAAKCPGVPGAAASTPPAAKDGRDGVTPPCMQTPRQCQGEDGKPGGNGTDGVTPPCYFTPMQCQGADGKDAPAPAQPFSVIDTDCVGDDAASQWVTTVSNGTEQKKIVGSGPCRIGPDPN